MTEYREGTNAPGSNDKRSGEEDPPKPDDDRSSSWTIKKPESDFFLARLWDNGVLFHFVAFLTLIVLPYLVMFGVNYWQGSLTLPGEQQGLFESQAFHTYFLISFLCLTLARRALEKMYDTLQSFKKQNLVRFEDDNDSGYVIQTESKYFDMSGIDFTSQLSREGFSETMQFYRFLLAKVTFRGNHETVSCPESYRPTYRWMKYGYLLAVLGGVIILGVTTVYHWFAETAYGYDIWFSANYPVGFAVRFVYDAFLFVLLGPFLVAQVTVLLYLMYHPFKYLNARNGLRFRRYAPDGVGGFSKFGNQAFNNVLIFLPFYIAAATYYLYLPLLTHIIVGVLLYTLAFPVLFIAQLFTSHLAMKDAIETELEIVGQTYGENYIQYKEHLLGSGSSADVNDKQLAIHHHALGEADAVYNEIRNRPTWPFERTVVAKVVSLTLSLFSGVALAAIEVFML